jgi:hypothetical protein
MPIAWGVNHHKRVVFATGRGVLTNRDFDSYLDDLAAAAVAIGARIRSHEVHQLMGRVAVVAASDELYEQAEKFNSKVLAERKLRIFRDVASALAWLTDSPIDSAQFAKSYSRHAEHDNA